MQIPEDLRYAENHEWVRQLDGGIVRVGITDYAQDALGDIVFVELPDLGTTCAAGDAFGEVESTKSVSDVYAPVAGEVVARNDVLEDTPEIINSDPYGDGWFIDIELEAGADLDTLMTAAAYAEYTSDEE